MAAKKTTSKSTAPPKGIVKTASKPEKAESPAIAAKPTATKKPVATRKPTAAKKLVEKKSEVSVASTAEVKVAVEVAKSAPAVKSELSSHKAAPTKTRSSLVNFPVPPAPVRPPFVPPKAEATSAVGSGPAAGNGAHSPAFIQKQRQRLLDLRDELVDSMSGMTRDTIRNAPEGSEASGSGQHQGDAGSDAYDRDFALSVLAKEQDALYEIEQALRRIQLGTYGTCEISARKILQTRLEVIPFARLTVECQAQWEKEYGKRRFRPSNEVGFSGGKYVDDEDSESVSLDEDED